MSSIPLSELLPFAFEHDGSEYTIMEAPEVPNVVLFCSSAAHATTFANRSFYLNALLSRHAEMLEAKYAPLVEALEKISAAATSPDDGKPKNAAQLMFEVKRFARATLTALEAGGEQA